MNRACVVAVDGSESSLRAVDYAIADAASRQQSPHIYLVNVQPALSSNVTRFIDAKTVEDFHRETGDEALADALAHVEAAGLSHSAHVLVGEAAPSLVDFAQAKNCDLIIMGTHGLGSVLGMVMGSVATKVLHLSTLPVLLVK
ncbi:universal stress protein [Rhodoferax sp.]|uniref:universal stress protein n=1 Tax=Rhodoferax sp. TaxID=50421 RepID=UPI00284C2A02|nr:universal stress protein [Rhodoferax sp.]MDR3369836.1 universal stress protein [Rhodoferax sp.]